MTDPTPNPDPKPTDPAPVDSPKPEGDKPLGPGGEKALAAEREARKALEKQVADLAPLAKLASALGGGDAAKGKTEIETLAERQAEMEKTLAEERAARWRAEVAHEKNLTPQQAARLVGASREALVADADALIALFPTPPAGNGTPKPDPSQGAGGTPIDLDARIAEATKAGNIGLAISLENQKLSKAK